MTHSVTVVQVPQRVIVAHESNRITTIAAPEHAVVRVTAPRIAVVRTVEKVVVRGTGAQGPPGPPGPSGSKFIYVQSTPTATWIVPHNLNGYVDVTILNAANTIVEADVVETDLNTATVMFSLPQSGIAIVS